MSGLTPIGDFIWENVRMSGLTPNLTPNFQNFDGKKWGRDVGSKLSREKIA